MKSFMHFKAAATDSVIIIVGHRVADYDYTFKWRRFNTAKLSVCGNEASQRRQDFRRRWTSGANRNALGSHNKKISRWPHRFYCTSRLLFFLKMLRNLWSVLSSYVTATQSSYNIQRQQTYSCIASIDTGRLLHSVQVPARSMTNCTVLITVLGWYCRISQYFNVN